MQEPLQKVLFKEKDRTWRRNNMLYFYNKCYPQNAYFESLYKAANGELEATDYTHVTNPFGKAISGREQLKSYPARLKNYPIIPPILQLMMGEKRDRPFVSLVTVLNGDSVNLKKQQEMLIVKKFTEQKYLETLKSMGIDTGAEDYQPVPELEKSLQDFNENWSDYRAIVGQEVLEYIMADCEVPRKLLGGYMHWLVTGCVFTLKDVRGEDVHYQVLNPKYVGWIADESSDFLEDAHAILYVQRLTKSSFLDHYGEVIANESKKDQEEIMDVINRKTNGMSEPYMSLYDNSDLISQSDKGYAKNVSFGSTNSNYYNDFQDTLEVAYANWSSQELVKVIRVTDEMGNSEDIEVGDDYIVDSEYGEELLETYWRTQKWEGYICNNKETIFGVRPIPYQRNRLSRKSGAKNLIAGRIRKLGDRKALSTVELLMPYQHLHNALHWKFNLTLSKDKAKLLTLPLDLIPKHEGWDMFTTMYHAEATGILWVDASNPNLIQALNAIKSIDLGLYQYLDALMNLMERIKNEAKSLVGITPQREANITGKAGLGVTDMAITQSMLVSEHMVSEYEEFDEKELNGLLDISKFAYINGKKASYINSEGRQTLIDIDAENVDYLNSEFGVFVKSSAKERDKLNKLKQFAETLASQGADASMLGKILNAENNFSKLLDELEDIEEANRLRQEQQAQADREMQDEISKRATDVANSELAFKYYNVDSQNQNKLEVKQLDNAGKQATMDADKNNIPDFIDIQTASVNNHVSMSKLKLESAKFVQSQMSEGNKIALEKEKLAVAREKIEADKYIAKTNKNKFDK